MNDFGTYLRNLRRSKGLGLRELSLMVTTSTGPTGITHAYLSLIESGRKPAHSHQILHVLAHTLSVSIIEMEMASRG
jgi:transcriptional regulator with XRE-family HTH domain